jgi:cell division protein FtsL
MPRNIVPYMVMSAGTLFAIYVTLVVVTIVYATLQTKLAYTMGDTQTQITTLESSYYASVTELDTMNPYAHGYVKPTHIEFVAAATVPALSFASR